VTIVFDFDGTLADTYGIVLALYNAEAANYGLRTISAEDWEEIRHMRFGEMLKFAGIKPHQVPKYVTIGKQVLKAHIEKIVLFDGIVDMVHRLKAAGHDLFVLSSNAEDTIQAVLDRYDIREMSVMKSSKLFGKAAPLKRLVRLNHLEPDQVWMVGDEIRDVVAADKAGIKSLAVTWGFHPKEMLESAHPEAYADTPKQVVDFFEK
jgi:phosphoglycolate phosphatase